MRLHATTSFGPARRAHPLVGSIGSTRSGTHATTAVTLARKLGRTAAVARSRRPGCQSRGRTSHTRLDCSMIATSSGLWESRHLGLRISTAPAHLHRPVDRPIRVQPGRPPDDRPIHQKPGHRPVNRPIHQYRPAGRLTRLPPGHQPDDRPIRPPPEYQLPGRLIRPPPGHRLAGRLIRHLTMHRVLLDARSSALAASSFVDTPKTPSRGTGKSLSPSSTRMASRATAWFRLRRPFDPHRGRQQAATRHCPDGSTLLVRLHRCLRNSSRRDPTPV